MARRRKPGRSRARKPIPRKPAAPSRRAPATPKPASGEPPSTVPPKAAPAAQRPKSAPARKPAVVRQDAPKPKVEVIQKDPLIGQTIGRCKLLDRVGRGKTAVVYRAHYEALDDTVAVKILTPEAKVLAALVERFHSEARVIARLDNENIVKIYDVGTEGEHHYMVMELLDGISLQELITRDGRLDVMDALRVTRQAANGLAAAHAQGIIHRDVKPQNLLLLEDGTVKVLDFGLAAQFDESSERVGTPHYMAPEVCKSGDAELGSDVYALGIGLYHLLVGQPPYAGNDVGAILRLHMKGEPLRPERQRHDLPKDVCELIRTLTKRDPLLRPSSSDVVELLDTIGGEQLQEKETLKRRRHRTRGAIRRRKSKSPVAIGFVAVGLAALAIVIAVNAGGDGKSSDGPDATVGRTPQPSVPVAPTATQPVAPVAPVQPDPEAERRAREAAEQETERLRLVQEGKEAFQSAEAWARENWRSQSDTEAVLAKYRSVASRFKRTEAADRAKQRVKDINSKKAHPHPDRSWSDAASIAEARAAWRDAQSKVEELIAKHQYAQAGSLVPDIVNDADGQLAGELAFWHEHLSHLKDFQRLLVKAVGELPDDKRTIQTPDGEGNVRLVSPQSLKIRIDGSLASYAWDQLEPKEIAALARRAFRGKGARFYLLQMAFAFAHRLENKFWDLDLDLRGASDGKAHAAAHRAYTERYGD